MTAETARKLGIVKDLALLIGMLLTGLLWLISQSNNAASMSRNRITDKLDTVSQQVSEVRVDVKELRVEVQNLKVGQARLEQQSKKP